MNFKPIIGCVVLFLFLSVQIAFATAENQCFNYLAGNKGSTVSPLNQSDGIGQLRYVNSILGGGKSLWTKKPREFLGSLIFLLDNMTGFSGTGYQLTDKTNKFISDSLKFIGTWSPNSVARFSTELSVVAMSLSRQDKTNMPHLSVIKGVLDKALKQRDSLSKSQLASVLVVQVFLGQTLSKQKDKKALKTRIEYLEELLSLKTELQTSALSISVPERTFEAYRAFQMSVLLALVTSREAEDLDLVGRAIDLTVSFDSPLSESGLGEFRYYLGTALDEVLKFITKHRSALPAGSFEKLKGSLELTLPPSVLAKIFVRASNTLEVDKFEVLKDRIKAIEDLEVRAEAYRKIYTEALVRTSVSQDFANKLLGEKSSLTEGDLKRVVAEFPYLAYQSNPNNMENMFDYFSNSLLKEESAEALDALSKTFMEVSGYLLKLSFALKTPGFSLPEKPFAYTISINSLKQIITFMHFLPTQQVQRSVLSQVESLGSINKGPIIKSIQDDGQIFLPLIMGAYMIHAQLQSHPYLNLNLKGSEHFTLTEKSLAEEFGELLEFMDKSGILKDYSDFVKVDRSN
jgi:hypothetical protein